MDINYNFCRLHIEENKKNNYFMNKFLKTFEPIV